MGTLFTEGPLLAPKVPKAHPLTSQRRSPGPERRRVPRAPQVWGQGPTSRLPVSTLPLPTYPPTLRVAASDQAAGRVCLPGEHGAWPSGARERTVVPQAQSDAEDTPEAPRAHRLVSAKGFPNNL